MQHLNHKFNQVILTQSGWSGKVHQHCVVSAAGPSIPLRCTQTGSVPLDQQKSRENLFEKIKLPTGINQKQAHGTLATLKVWHLYRSKKPKYTYEPHILQTNVIAKTRGNSAKHCTTPTLAEWMHGVHILVLLKVLHCLFSVGFISTKLLIFTFLLSLSPSLAAYHQSVGASDMCLLASLLRI